MKPRNFSELKHDILRLIREDEEFRLAVAGLLGFEEILRRLDKHEEELKKLREDFNNFVREQEKRWEENNKRWEENNRKWEEAYKRFEAIERAIQFQGEKIAELIKAIGELKAFMGSIGRRMGRDLEKTILALYRDAIERFNIDIEKIEKISFRDYDGKYLHKGARIEIDIYASDKETYLIEVKSLVDEDDVEWFNTRCYIVAREKNIPSYKKLLVAIDITREALERAKELGIETVYGSVID